VWIVYQEIYALSVSTIAKEVVARSGYRLSNRFRVSSLMFNDEELNTLIFC
jgi:hypothetical protein